MNIILEGILSITGGQLIMIGLGLLLMYLGIKKEYEPTLLVPMGLGAILVNIPNSGLITHPGSLDKGILNVLFEAGIENELFPLLIFIGIGAMIDFGPLLQNPFMFLFGAAAQFGIFFTIIIAVLFGFNLEQSAAIGMIGSADGPTSILAANVLAPELLGPITVAAYSYMALVPIIQPPAIRLVTTKAERSIRMPYKAASVSRKTLILFPIIVTIVAGLIAPASLPLVGFLMFGNLLRECGVLNRLSHSAQNELVNLISFLTVFLTNNLFQKNIDSRFVHLTTVVIFSYYTIQLENMY